MMVVVTGVWILSKQLILNYDYEVFVIYEQQYHPAQKQYLQVKQGLLTFT
jgi:hypothetical protein